MFCVQRVGELLLRRTFSSFRLPLSRLYTNLFFYTFLYLHSFLHLHPCLFLPQSPFLHHTLSRGDFSQHHSNHCNSRMPFSFLPLLFMLFFFLCFVVVVFFLCFFFIDFSIDFIDFFDFGLFCTASSSSSRAFDALTLPVLHSPLPYHQSRPPSFGCGGRDR